MLLLGQSGKTVKPWEQCLLHCLTTLQTPGVCNSCFSSLQRTISNWELGEIRASGIRWDVTIRWACQKANLWGHHMFRIKTISAGIAFDLAEMHNAWNLPRTGSNAGFPGSALRSLRSVSSVSQRFAEFFLISLDMDSGGKWW